MELIEIMQNRHSVRSYKGERIPDEKIEMILNAGLLSPSGRAKRPWEFILVRDQQMLKKMADCREGAADMLKGADAAIVVIADESMTDVWIEDASITMAYMHLMADSLGVGSCWIQGRLRTARTDMEADISTEDYLRQLLSFPESYRLEAILSLGMPKSHPAKTEMDSLPFNKVHRESF